MAWRVAPRSINLLLGLLSGQICQISSEEKTSDLWKSMVHPNAHGDVLEESPCLHV